MALRRRRPFIEVYSFGARDERPSARGRIPQETLHGNPNGIDAVRGAEFPVDIAKMHLDRDFLKPEELCDFLIAHPFDKELKCPVFLWAEVAEVR